MTIQEGKPWCEIADDMVRSTFVQKQAAMVLLSELAPSVEQTAQVAENYSNGAKGVYLWSRYLETVESNPATPTDLVAKLSALRAQISESPDWSQKATVFRQFVEKNPTLMNGYFEYDFSTVKVQLADKFGHLFPEFLPKLSLGLQAISTPVHVVADYKEGVKLAQPYVDNRDLSTQAAADYADVYASIKLIQTATMHLEPAMGYPMFRDWAEKYHVSESIKEALDPTGVSRAVQSFAPEA